MLPFYSRGVEIELIFTLGTAVSEIRADLLHIYTLFLPTGSKLSLFLLYGQRFPRHGPNFKIAIIGHETWPLAKVPEYAHVPSSTTGGGRN